MNEVIFVKVPGLKPPTLLKTDFLHRYFAGILITLSGKAILRNTTY